MSKLVLKSKERLSAALLNSMNIACNELKISEYELSIEKLKSQIRFESAKQEFGDLSCNVAMVCAGIFKKSPSAVSAILASHLNLEGTEFERCETTEGYMNFFYNKKFYPSVIKEVICRDKNYGQNEFGLGKTFSISINNAKEERIQSISKCLTNIYKLCGYSEVSTDSDEDIILCSCEYHKDISDKRNLYVDKFNLKGEKVATLDKDALRFLHNSAKANEQINLTINEDTDSLYYYVQFAYARICSIFRCLEMDGIKLLDISSCKLLCTEAEIRLIKEISSFSDQLIYAAKTMDTSRIIKYSINISTLFHRFYNSSKIRGTSDELLQARLALCKASQITLRNSLYVCGISPDETV